MILRVDIHFSLSAFKKQQYRFNFWLNKKEGEGSAKGTVLFFSFFFFFIYILPFIGEVAFFFPHGRSGS